MTTPPPAATDSPAPPQARILGLDLARALAIFGMILVNYRGIMNAGQSGPDQLIFLVDRLEGRAAATFVILAGIGISLLTRRARTSGDAAEVWVQRRRLWKRALLLFVIGLAFAPIWLGDILDYYGVYFAIAALFIVVPGRWLWVAAVGFGVGFIVLFARFDYFAYSGCASLDCLQFWTVPGMIRHLFFDGYYPVVPWMAYLLVGMWLGRRDLGNPAFRRRAFVGAAAVALLTEVISRLLIHTLASTPAQTETLETWLSTQVFPPMPGYLLAAGSTAVAVIMLSLALADRFPKAWWVKALVAAGQLALTLYIGHVVVGLGILDLLGLLTDQPLWFAIVYALLVFVLGVGFAVLWRRRFARGPLEWVMRRLAG